jgi:predicted RNA-binding Zn-ribbon protein involved in translation (DUF1610 family)
MCSGCGVTLTTPDSSAGKRAKCPKCGGAIQIPDVQQEEIYEAESSLFSGLSEDEMTSGSVVSDERKPCPACGEMIVRDAVKCRYCGEIFDATLKKQEQKRQKKSTAAIEGEEMTTGDWVVAILCSGIGCIAGIVWMIQGKPKGKKMLMVSLAVQGFWVIVQVIAASMSQGR